MRSSFFALLLLAASPLACGASVPTTDVFDPAVPPVVGQCVVGTHVKPFVGPSPRGKALLRFPYDSENGYRADYSAYSYPLRAGSEAAFGEMVQAANQRVLPLVTIGRETPDTNTWFPIDPAQCPGKALATIAELEEGKRAGDRLTAKYEKAKREKLERRVPASWPTIDGFAFMASAAMRAELYAMDSAPAPAAHKAPTELRPHDAVTFVAITCDTGPAGKKALTCRGTPPHGALLNGDSACLTAKFRPPTRQELDFFQAVVTRAAKTDGSVPQTIPIKRPGTLYHVETWSKTLIPATNGCENFRHRPCDPGPGTRAHHVGSRGVDLYLPDGSYSEGRLFASPKMANLYAIEVFERRENERGIVSPLWTPSDNSLVGAEKKVEAQRALLTAESPPLLRIAALVNRGIVLLRVGRVEEAREAMKQVRALRAQGVGGQPLLRIDATLAEFDDIVVGKWSLDDPCKVPQKVAPK